MARGAKLTAAALITGSLVAATASAGGGSKAGALDRSFGKHGLDRTTLGDYGGEANAVAVQADGKIVVVGSAWVDAELRQQLIEPALRPPAHRVEPLERPSRLAPVSEGGGDGAVPQRELEPSLESALKRQRVQLRSAFLAPATQRSRTDARVSRGGLQRLAVRDRLGELVNERGRKQRRSSCGHEANFGR